MMPQSMKKRAALCSSRSLAYSNICHRDFRSRIVLLADRKPCWKETLARFSQKMVPNDEIR